MKLFFENTLLDKNLDHYYRLYKKLFKRTLKVLNLKSNYILSCTIVDKTRIHEINKEFRNIDKPTDVISFAFLDDINEKQIKSDFPTDLGEIYICFDVAIENAKLYGNSEKRELSFLFVHGLLHLLGYDHMTKEDEEIMFPLQEKILQKKRGL